MPKPDHGQHSDSQNQSFTDFLSNVPAPLVSVLVGLAPCIASVRHAIDVVSWKASWEESWLTIALWWAACLLGDVALRYVLPIALLAVLFIARLSSTPHVFNLPVTEDALQRTITDLTVIHALLPHFPSVPSATLPILLRVFALLYLPYLILTYLVRLRVLIAIAGTLVLAWRARWAALIRRGLWRSAWFRWGVYQLWSKLSGTPLPPRNFSPHTLLAQSKVTTPSTNQIRFLFTVYENQRWWMGLDWTAALLPGERPSWCSGSQQPVAPPSAFALPSSTTAYMMEGKIRMKRTATWKWEEEEWRVLICKESGGGLTRIERPVPAGDELAASAGANRILKAAGKMRQASMSQGGGSMDGLGEDGEGKVERSSSIASAKVAEVDEEVFTDGDGWVYGDNKWEHGSSKGGMGKYTRYRRWTRIAVLDETIEPVEPGDLGIHKPVPLPISPASPTHVIPGQLFSPPPYNEKDPSSLSSSTSTTTTTTVTPPSNSNDTPPASSSTSASSTNAPYDDASRLKQRLQSVVKRTTMSLGGSGSAGHSRTESTGSAEG